MSNTVAPLPIRLFCDRANPANISDLNIGSGGAAFFYRGDDIQIDIGLGDNGVLLTDLSGSGDGGIASVTCQLFARQNDTSPPMMSRTVLSAAMNLGLTQAQWSNNTDTGDPIAPPIFTTIFQHASFQFSNTETGISLNDAVSQNYWLRIFSTTSDAPAKNITWLDGPITVKDGPISANAAPVPPGWKVVTVAGISRLALLDNATGNYYTLDIDTVGGIRSLSLGDTAY